MQHEPKYWFPAKRYGWGWGLPCSWQGWVVLFVYLGLVVAGSRLFPPGRGPWYFTSFVAFLSILLIAVCWLKGERGK